MKIHLMIPGKPRTKGSYVAIMPKYRGVHNDGTPFLKNADKHLGEWTNLLRITWEAQNPRAVWPYFPDPVSCFEVDVLVEMCRPNKHFGTGRNAGVLKKNAPKVLSCPKIPDNDKVLRAILDALTGYAWEDDKQVVMVKLRKVWSTLDSTSIVISLVDPDADDVDSSLKEDRHGNEVLPE